MSDELKQSLKDAKVVMFNQYCYMIHPLLDGFPKIDLSLLDEVSTRMVDIIKQWDDFDVVVTIEAMGIHLATAVCLKINKPLLIIRKRRYGVDGEQELFQKTGYGKSSLFLNGLKPNSRVVVIDDVISTGATLRAILPALAKNDAKVLGVVAVVDKSGISAQLQQEFCLPVVPLEYVKVSPQGVKVVSKEEMGNG